MKKTVYSCDICRDATETGQLKGLHFMGMKKFRLSAPESTDGIHICNGCLDQLREQLSPQPETAVAEGPPTAYTNMSENHE